MTDGTEYFRAADIARLTGMSLRTVRRWIADEIIPSTKLGGATLTWNHLDLVVSHFGKKRLT
jgi:excisionase family DNA binding protein